MDSLDPTQLIQRLTPFVRPERMSKIDRVLSARTDSHCLILEGIYDQGNICAVLRTAEALGFQRIHIIETAEHFKRANRVSQGADKWLDIYRWKSIEECVEAVKKQGYLIAATHLGELAEPISRFNFAQNRTAIVFGNERDGVSPRMLELADRQMVLPMLGFTQSFNISVAAALALGHVTATPNACQPLSLERTMELKARFLLGSIPQKSKFVQAMQLQHQEYLI